MIIKMWYCVYSNEYPKLSINCCHADAECRQVLVNFTEIDQPKEET